MWKRIMGNQWKQGMECIEIFSGFQAMHLEECWLSHFRFYLQSWRIEAVGEGKGNKDKQKEEEKVFNTDKG